MNHYYFFGLKRNKIKTFSFRYINNISIVYKSMYLFYCKLKHLFPFLELFYCFLYLPFEFSIICYYFCI
ncbi:hypothetical protein PJIAN_1767 [Paludibacter jiangxiensis]|uniref:Uncharacterized protein n=1 Tax=Paludibacter jiangxiensis TaxID=681398 RepID=A0A161LDD6_9BACT|nr:hypothetical protein PJIAN_1767 [Paludibacter jiangxiensis]